MSYEKYLNSIEGCIYDYRNAKRSGVVFSRFEKFDYLFKKELLVEEGVLKDAPFLRKRKLFIKSVDYRVACFYAKFFSDVMFLENNYSFGNIRMVVRDIVKYAYNNCICLDKFKVLFTDKNSVLYIGLIGKNSEFALSIKGKDDVARCLLDIISILGSEDEREDVGRLWLRSYLNKEYEAVKSGGNSSMYVEGDRKLSSLNDFVNKDAEGSQIEEKKEIISERRYGNIVNFR